MTPHFRAFCFAVFIVAAVLALTKATLAIAADDADDELTPEQVQVKCAEEGGCAYVSKRWVMQLLRGAVEHGRNLGREEGARICAKGRT